MKNKALLIIKNVVPVILFNIIFFVTWGFNNPASVWISYGLIHFAYAMLVVSSLFNKASAKNVFFSFTNNSISLIYCILEFVAGFVFIILRLETVNISLYVQLPLLAIYAVAIIYNIFFNDKTEANTVSRQIEIDFIKICTMKLDLVLTKQLDENAKKKLTKARELMSTSPCKSCEQVKPIEEEILSLLEKIGEEPAESDRVENLTSLLIDSINKRNITIKGLH